MEIPERCIDVKEFVYLMLRVPDAASSLHIGKTNEIKANWKQSALKKVAKSLSAYAEIHNLALIARVRRTSKLAFALADFFLTDPRTSKLVDAELKKQAGELQALATLMHIEAKMDQNASTGHAIQDSPGKSH